MSGFLHRLAAQAMGLTKPVRTIARLPFTSVHTWDESFDSAATEAPLENEMPAAKPMRPSRPADPISLNKDHTPEVADGASQANAPRLGEKLLPPLMRPVPPRIVEPPQTTLRAQSPRVSELPQTAFEARQFDDDRLAQGSAEEAQPTPEGLGEIAEARPETATEAQELRLRQPRLRFAEPLLPQRPLVRFPQPGVPGRDLTAPAAPGSATPDHPGTVAEPTEVHVNIGRIEVTAVHASPTPKRTPAPGKKPMSLDEYLTKRNEG